MDIYKELSALADEKYRSFQSALIPDVDTKLFLGVRTPAIRKMAKQLIKCGEADAFMAALPHRYFDGYQLHALIISQLKDYDRALAETERFLPFVNNWATCDQLRPAAFKGRQEELLPHIRRWLDDGRCYVVRFGMEMLMLHYLGDCFDEKYLAWVSDAVSDGYYVRMMQAWFFAEALALQYEASLPFIVGRRLSPWVHNKAIQKACESLKIPDDRKAVLSAMKLKITK